MKRAVTFVQPFALRQRVLMTTSHFPKYLILHADINETAIAGDGAKGYDGTQTLQLAASKYVGCKVTTTLPRFRGTLGILNLAKCN